MPPLLRGHSFPVLVMFWIQVRSEILPDNGFVGHIHQLGSAVAGEHDRALAVGDKDAVADVLEDHGRPCFSCHPATDIAQTNHQMTYPVDVDRADVDVEGVNQSVGRSQVGLEDRYLASFDCAPVGHRELGAFIVRHEVLEGDGSQRLAVSEQIVGGIVGLHDIATLVQKDVRVGSRLENGAMIGLRLTDSALEFFDLQLNRDASDQFVDVERFGDIVVGALFQALSHLGALVEGAQDDDGYRRSEIEVLNVVQERISIHHRHHKVEQDQVRAALLETFETFDPVLGEHDLVTRLGQGVLEQLSDVAFVVYDQNLCHLVHDPLRCAGRLDTKM